MPKRTLTVVAILLALAAAAPASAHHGKWHNPKQWRHTNVRACPSGWWHGSYAHRISETRRLVACEARLFGVSVAVSLRVADCETDFEWWEDGPNRGLFQHRRPYWDGRQRLYAPASHGWRPSALNARTNTVVTMKKVKREPPGWLAWSCY
jgi:hypothetical protein